VQVGAAALAADIRARSVSAVEVVEACLAEAARHRDLNAFAVLDGEGARAAAVAADQQLARGHGVGPLHGVPVTAKEQIAVAGLPSCEASRLVAPVVAAEDAPPVAALRAAGAIVLGTTNMSELATFPDSVNLVYGATRNPHGASRSAGGSSGGEGCAVAAGLSALGLGSDYGGSVRCPAHFCGVAGLRVGLGTLPSPPARTAARARLSTYGVLARSVADLELALDALAPGPAPPRPRRITVVRRDEAVDVAAEALAGLGFEVVDGDPPQRAEAEHAFDSVTAHETRALLARWLPERLTEASPQLAVQWRAVEALEADERAYRAALGRLEELGERVELGVLLAPPAAGPAFALGRLDGVFELFDDCKLASALGLPALVVPVLRAGLPRGVQLIGPRGGDRQLLSLGRALEQALR
jgi:amidase